MTKKQPITGNRTSRVFLLLFLVFSLANLLAVALPSSLGIFLTKPFLMVWLALHFYTGQKKPLPAPGRLILAGLLFSLGGDVLLMFQGENPVFFLAGLGSFLCAHICYILSFLSFSGPGAVRKRPWLALPLLAFGALMLTLLWPHLPDAFRIPVALYTVVITGMGIAALNRLGTMPAVAFRFLFGGALFFIASDSCLAVAKFMGDSVVLPQAGLIVMATYLLGQWGIVKSVVVSRKL